MRINYLKAFQQKLNNFKSFNIHDFKHVTKNTTSVAVLLIAGSELMQYSPNGPIRDALAGILATFTASGAVKVKLMAQAEKNPGLTTKEFLMIEKSNISNHFYTVWFKDNAFSGGGMYAMRGGITKALMFVGYDSILSELKKNQLDELSATVLAGLSSGAIQGLITAIPEWIATKQAIESKKPFREHGKEMIDYIKKNNVYPITSQIARNSVFDCVFFVLTRYFEIKFALAAPIAMTSAYQFEKIRSLTQQGKTSKDLEEIFMNDSKKDRYTGWFAKAIEFSIVYAFLDYFRNNGELKKDHRLNKKTHLSEPTD